MIIASLTLIIFDWLWIWLVLASFYWLWFSLNKLVFLGFTLNACDQLWSILRQQKPWYRFHWQGLEAAETAKAMSNMVPMMIFLSDGKVFFQKKFNNFPHTENQNPIVSNSDRWEKNQLLQINFYQNIFCQPLTIFYKFVIW